MNRRERKPRKRDTRLRPTTSRARSAIFSMLGPNGVLGKKGLDLYAGTGAVGIEMLRRGAVSVDFVEASRSRAIAIEKAVATAGFGAQAVVHRSDTVTALKHMNDRTFDIVFSDPPYEIETSSQVLRTLHENQLLESGARIIFEHSARLELPDRIGDADAIRKRRYGDSAITIYSFD